MANEQRKWGDFVGGLVENNPLSASATSFDSAGLAALPAVGSTEHMLVIFDPDGRHGGAPFAKRVTAHTAAATSATIEAAAIIGTARQIDRDTPWVHSVVAADLGSAWTAYTPTWTSDSSNGSLGNGSIFGAYRQSAAKELTIRGSLIFGSTTTQGTGGWWFSLPSGFTAKTLTNVRQIISAWALDNSATAIQPGVGRFDSGETRMRLNIATTTGGNSGSGAPWAWATGDEAHWSGTIEID